MSRFKQAAKDIDEVLKNFIPPRQLQVIGDLCRGEERDFFFAKLTEFRERIEKMPKTYEQDGSGEEAVAYLHYFGPNSDFYILEKDMGEADNPNDVQHQAYGLASINGEPPGNGYISLPELFSGNVELDLHFEPTKVSQILRQKYSGPAARM